MVVVQWLVSNWQAILSIVSMGLGVGVAIAHLAHKDAMAAKIQGIEDTINKIDSGNSVAKS